MVNYRIENITGASFSGSAGTGRTYTLAYSNANTAAFFVQVQGVLLTQFYDFTVSGGVLTVNTYLANADVVVLNYLTDVSGLPSGTSYTTADLVRSEIRADTAFSSTTTPTLAALSNWILEESRLIDSITGQVYSETTVSSSYQDYDGSSIYRFPHMPLTEVTKVEYNVNSNSVAASWIEFEDGYGYNYLEYLDEAEIEFIHGQSSTHKITPVAGKKKLRLTYKYGYTAVPYDIQKLATLMVSKRVIMSLINSQSNEEGGAIQVGTISVSDPSNYSINYIKNLNTEIEDTIKKVGDSFKTFRNVRVYD